MTMLSTSTSNRRSIAAALLLTAMTLTFWPSPARADARRADIWIKYEDMPRRVRELADRERGRRDIKQVLEMRREGHVYYRVLIDDRGADRAVFFSEGGRLLKVSEVPDVAIGEGSFEKWVKFDELPRGVRITLDRERGNREIKQIMFVRRDNREFYRAIIDTRGDDLAIRVNTAGKILSVDEVDDIAIGSREISRFDVDRERSIRFEDVPRDVKRVIERERNGNPIKQIVFVERNGRVFYRCIIDDRRGDRILRIAEDGYLYEEKEVPDIAVGAGGFDSNRFGHESAMVLKELPWNVREALDHERKGRDVKEIIYVRRGGYTFYRAIIDTRGDDLAVRISDSGRVLSREEVDDISFGKEEVEYAAAREEWVKYATLSRPAQAVLDRYRRGREVLKIIRVEYRGHVTYRCTIDSKPWPTILRVSEEGRVVGEE
jgi:hypothetical protein